MRCVTSPRANHSVRLGLVRAPEGNGCAERFIRTLKENLLWVQTFDTVEQLRHALIEFREIYNTTWLIERHGFRQPAALAAQILDFLRGGGPRRVAGQTLLAGFQKFLRPAVIQVLHDPFGTA